MIADLVVIAEHIHPVSSPPGAGFVATAGGRIAAVDTNGGAPDAFVGPGTQVIRAAGSVVPGLHDHHAFFTSQLLEAAGRSAAGLSDEAACALADAQARNGGRVFLRHVEAGRAEHIVAELEAREPAVDAVVLERGRDAIALSSAAARRLGPLIPGSNEALHPLYAQLAEDSVAVRAAWAAARDRMHRGGVVSVKDIAFDTHLGMLPTIRSMSEDGSLGLRYAFAAQPVSAPADLSAAAEWVGDRLVRFQGFKLMTDGSFDELTADLLPPDDAWRERQTSSVDYERVRIEAERILAAGFPLALNADGDGAVRACLEIFARSAHALPAGCSISDASLVDGVDAARMAALGLSVETYPQMLRFDGYTIEMLEELLGAERGKNLCNLSALQAAGVPAAAGTDFPLFDPSLPEAMLSASERRLGSGPPVERWHRGLGVSREDVLRMWTATAADVMGQRGEWGVLETGAAADIAVFDRDLFRAEAASLAEASVDLVVAAGSVVYAR